jgi:hypothetical protein
LAAVVLCFAVDCSTNYGVNRIFLTKDLVAEIFGIFHYIFLGSVVADVRICGQKKICGGWLDYVWSSNLPNYVFQVSSKINTGPALCSNATSGIACPWPSTPWGLGRTLLGISA